MVEHGWDSPLLATLSENQLEGEIVFYILGGREVGGEVPLGSILSAMSASAVHNSVGRLWREIWEVGFTRSQLARSIARENPARTLGRSIKRHVTHYIAHASIKSHVTFRQSPPQATPPIKSPPGCQSPRATPQTQSLPGSHSPKRPPDKVPRSCHPRSTLEKASRTWRHDANG